jgi:hypothetical protein
MFEFFFPRLSKRLKNYRIKRYKKNKIKAEKSTLDRVYMLRFKVKINDKQNPQESTHELEMLIPAKAAFFAKREALKHIQRSIELVYVGVDEVEEIEE